jgi:SAM-dependent methyltransferase
MDLSNREAREIDAFDKELAGSHLSDDTLVMPSHEIERYRHPYTGKRFPIDLLFRIVGEVRGRRVLDIGCGDGFWSTMLGFLGGHVTGIDVSELHVNVAARRSKVNGLADSVVSLQASVHDLPFASETFDIVFGNAILHHVDARRAGEEIGRVLRKGGYAVFLEPVALSIALRRIRKTKLMTILIKENRVSPDEEPLDPEQINAFSAGFSEVRIHECQMISRLERVVGGGKPYKLLNDFDNRLFQLVPPLRRFARRAVIELVK